MKFLFLLFLSFSVVAQEQAQIWGKIIKVDKTLQNMTYQYFMTYEVDGKFHAYPLDTNDKKIAEEISKNVSQMVRMKGSLKTIKIMSDGSAKEIPIFIPETLSPLKLSELSISDKVDPSPFENRANPNSYQEQRTGGIVIRINDTLANTMIFTGAAVLMGSALLQSMKKK